MADIDLQKKQRSWAPWIIAALVAVLAIWAVAEMFDDDTPMAGDYDPAIVEPAPAPATGAAAEMGPAGEGTAAAIADFRQTCAAPGAEAQDMAQQHDWTVGCLESMTAALDAGIRADTVGSVVLEQRLSSLRDRADEVRQSDPSATTHAGTVAEAFDAGAELIRTYQQERGTTGADYAAGVQQAADELTADQPLLEQRDAVHRYFSEVGDALQTMTT